LFGFTIGKLGKNNMGKMNCEKGESCFFFDFLEVHFVLGDTWNTIEDSQTSLKMYTQV
jgi:hypothetical protein